MAGRNVGWFVPGLLICLFANANGAAAPAGARDAEAIAFLELNEQGRLVYGADAQGNRLPDFSCCGYGGGERPIPDATVRIVVEPVEGDNTQRLQRAIDYVASLPPDGEGLRGVVLLRGGTYPVFGGLAINASGVVLRGEGMDEGGTVLLGAGTSRRTLIRIAGTDKPIGGEPARKITDAFVPVGACTFHVDNTEGLKAGDAIRIVRPCSREWVERLGMDRFGGGLEGMFAWKPGSRELTWDRVIRSIDGSAVTVDAPITTAIEAELGGAVLRPYTWPGRIRNSGIENLRCVSETNPANPKDEDHAWMVVTAEGAEDVWVRRVTAEGFAGSAVAIYETCRRVSVEDCLSLRPVSEIGGYRRHAFFTMGQQTLFLRCWSESGRHDFSAGYCAAGPNAFVQCETEGSLDDSGPIESWAAGVLYDNVRIDGNALRIGSRGSRGEGIGWAAANSVLWQCSAAVIECARPPGAWNWAFGCWGEFEGDGCWSRSNEFVRPDSLYAAQLLERRGEDIRLLKRTGSSTSSPTIELAAEMTAASRQPAQGLKDFIRKLCRENPIPTDAEGAVSIDEIPAAVKPEPKPAKPLQLVDGRLVCDGRLLAGGCMSVPWWRGTIRPEEAAAMGPAVTRFVPGRSGTGFTDDLGEVIDTMIERGQAALEHNYGLWYDRRRDDHQRVRRMNGDVRPPFYEQPFARSGIGTAWDGLSRYDLTKYNLWYWGRLKEFADLCDNKGRVLLHQNYFQHNILEAGAHWADYPWRPANNINGTGFPEPPPYAGDKRIFLDEPFYDTTHPVRAPLHRAYIRQCLDAFADNSNVIQLTGAEYTGPAEFVEFWLDTILEWKSETGLRPLIALSCTKDVQDRVLADPRRASAVSVIDIRAWWYQSDGTLYAPAGGKHLAPRQHARLLRPKRTSFEQTVRAVREYRARYPDKAVIYSADPTMGWAVLMGGGSLPNLPKTTDVKLTGAAARMRVLDLPADGVYALTDGEKEYLIYATKKNTLQLDLPEGAFIVKQVNLKSGESAFTGQRVEGGDHARIEIDAAPGLLWLTKR